MTPRAWTVGTWWTLGSRVRAGDFSYLDLTTWTSGNVLVEGQWGVFNPVVFYISVGATFVSDLVLYALAVKLAFLCFAGCGMYFLAKELGSGRRTAVIVGCLLPLTGFTTYMDAASWTTGLMAFSAFPWLWLSLVKLRRGAWGLLPAAGFVAFIITIGYFHPALMAGLLVGAFLLVALWERDWAQVVNMVIVGAVLVLLFIPVFAPALLTADVTNRGSNAISSTGFWGPDASDLLTAGSIAPGAEIPNWRGATIPVPIFYVAWFLPVLAAGITRRFKGRNVAVAAVFGLFVLVLLVGPTEVGPLRFPARLLPYWSLAVLVALVVGAHDGQVQSLRAMIPDAAACHARLAADRRHFRGVLRRTLAGRPAGRRSDRRPGGALRVVFAGQTACHARGAGRLVCCDHFGRRGRDALGIAASAVGRLRRAR